MHVQYKLTCRKVCLLLFLFYSQSLKKHYMTSLKSTISWEFYALKISWPPSLPSYVSPLSSRLSGMIKKPWVLALSHYSSAFMTYVFREVVFEGRCFPQSIQYSEFNSGFRGQLCCATPKSHFPSLLFSIFPYKLYLNYPSWTKLPYDVIIKTSHLQLSAI